MSSMNIIFKLFILLIRSTPRMNRKSDIHSGNIGFEANNDEMISKSIANSDMKNEQNTTSEMSNLTEKNFLNKNDLTDSRKDVEKYSNLYMMMVIQFLTINHDSKEFVDKVRKYSIDKTVQNFESAFDEILNLLNQTKSSIGYRENAGLANMSENSNVSVYEMSEYIENLLKENHIIKSEKTKDENSKEVTQKIEKIVKDFLKENYYDENYEFEDADIPKEDIIKNEWIEQIADIELKELAYELRNTWKLLYKKINNSHEIKNSTLIPLKYPFTIPGGRFREIYYWDSYWIFDGQLACGMHKTVKYGLLNFVELIKKYNFIPNGTRLYYEGRSQPPYFVQMVYNLYEHSDDEMKKEILNGEFLKTAEIEYEFWMKNRVVKFEYNGEEYEMNRYFVSTDYPRPESFTEDIKTYENFKKANPGIKNYENKLYGHIKAAAESGWDFSTRWLLDGQDLHTIQTNDIIPVDLNAYLYQNEKILSELCELMGDKEKHIYYKEKYIKRETLINKILWNENSWMDYNFKTGKYTSERFYFSNLTPMFYSIKPPKRNNHDILYFYKKELFSYVGGVPAGGECKCPQQWDFPVVWAPHQEMIVKFLLKIEENKMAIHIARAFYRNVKSCFLKDKKKFFEKYICNELGSQSKHGEYEVQEGFGWTNGVLLRFLELFKELLSSKDIDHEKSYNEIVNYLESKIKKDGGIEDSVIKLSDPIEEKISEQIADVK